MVDVNVTLQITEREQRRLVVDFLQRNYQLGSDFKWDESGEIFIGRSGQNNSEWWDSTGLTVNDFHRAAKLLYEKLR